ncbi:MAG: hypothetical protein QOE23_529 [Pseudonocardiales bacterium]|nr:hypothetical protein [Pseudonocardiales bacterium]
MYCDKLDSEVRAFLESNPFGYVTKHDREEGRYFAHAKILRRPPASLGLLTGDAIHNIRASLDNLFWAFACRFHNPPRNHRIAFPIFKDQSRRGSKPGWDVGLNYLRSVAPAVGTVITDLQPFERSKADPSGDPLWMLERLWNDDKHKRVVPVASALPLDPRVQIRAIGGDFRVRARTRGFFANSGPFEDDAVLAGCMYDPAGHVEGDLEFIFTFDVAFPKEGPARGAPLANLVRGLHDHVRHEVLPRFEGL